MWRAVRRVVRVKKAVANGGRECTRKRVSSAGICSRQSRNSS
jgi:hypothetical protein